MPADEKRSELPLRVRDIVEVFGQVGDKHKFNGRTGRVMKRADRYEVMVADIGTIRVKPCYLRRSKTYIADTRHLFVRGVPILKQFGNADSDPTFFDSVFKLGGRLGTSDHHNITVGPGGDSVLEYGNYSIPLHIARMTARGFTYFKYPVSGSLLFQCRTQGRVFALSYLIFGEPPTTFTPLQHELLTRMVTKGIFPMPRSGGFLGDAHLIAEASFTLLYCAACGCWPAPHVCDTCRRGSYCSEVCLERAHNCDVQLDFTPSGSSTGSSESAPGNSTLEKDNDRGICGQCFSTIELRDVERHLLTECSKRVVVCPSFRCVWQGLPDQLNSHLESCERYISVFEDALRIASEGHDLLVVRRGNEHEHAHVVASRSSILGRSLVCDRCAEEVPKNTMRVYRKQHCRCRDVLCDACDVRLRQSELEEHRRVECAEIAEPCELCQLTVKRRMMARHTLSECRMRIASCPHHPCSWCDFADQLDAHRERCVFAEAACPQCLEVMPAGHMRTHACQRVDKRDECVCCSEAFSCPPAMLMAGGQRVCKHICMCMQCAGKLSSCPLCRIPYDGTTALPIELCVGEVKPPVRLARVTPELCDCTVGSTHWVSPLDVHFTHDTIHEFFKAGEQRFG